LERNNTNGTEDTLTRFPMQVDAPPLNESDPAQNQHQLDDTTNGNGNGIGNGYNARHSGYIPNTAPVNIPSPLATNPPNVAASSTSTSTRRDRDPDRERTPSMVLSLASPLNNAPRHPSVPSSGLAPTTPYGSLAANPIEIASAPRVQAQQPTYVNPSPAPRPMNTQPVFTPAAFVPPEEVCVECAMRDQDMADVDVTSRGVWDRESDVAYWELINREEEDEEAGIPPSDDPNVVRSTGDMLTERHMKIWLSIVRLNSIYFFFHCACMLIHWI
jgi:hypothetical protein